MIYLWYVDTVRNQIVQKDDKKMKHLVSLVERQVRHHIIIIIPNTICLSYTVQFSGSKQVLVSDRPLGTND